MIANTDVGSAGYKTYNAMDTSQAHALLLHVHLNPTLVEKLDDE